MIKKNRADLAPRLVLAGSFGEVPVHRRAYKWIRGGYENLA